MGCRALSGINGYRGRFPLILAHRSDLVYIEWSWTVVKSNETLQLTAQSAGALWVPSALRAPASTELRRWVYGGGIVCVERDGFTLRLETLVRSFAAECGYEKPIVVSGAYHVYEEGSEDVEYPYANEPGCYVFVANRKQVLYVGKGSRTVGGRIWSHIGRSGKGRVNARFPNAEQWLKEAQPDGLSNILSVKTRS